MYLVRLNDPSKQAPLGGNGCSPHGLVAAMVSQYQRLFFWFILSMNRMPGSAQSQVDLRISSQRARASTVLYTWPSKVRSKKSPVLTAAMKASVTPTLMLNPVNVVLLFLALMNSSMSGWSTRKTPI